MAIPASLRLGLVLWIAACLRLANADTCNPLNGPCSAIPGLPSSTYSIDFSQQTTTPSDWILADFAEVGYGAPNGANFTFAKRYDAPYIWSRFYVLFGRIEVVLKAAPGVGIITGSVMMSDDLDEIDWEWSGNNFATASGEVQTNYFGKGIAGYYDRGTTPAVNAPQDQFHTYALDWTPDALIWSIDGKNVRTLQNSGATSGEYQYPQTPARLHLGVWCAGDPDNNGATVAWGGGYTNFSLAPFSAYVKSVKITTPNPCSSWQYPNPFNGSYKAVLCTNQTAINTLPCTYAVAQGDDGYKIADTLGVSFAALKAANANVNWDTLLVGQSLTVPGGNCPTSSSTSLTSSTSSSLPIPTNSTSATAVISSTNTSATLISTTSTVLSSATTPTNSTSPPVTSAGMTNPSSGTVMQSSISPSSATTQSPQASSYTVVAGDYGYAIASKLGCSFDDLKAANAGLDWDKLMIGQTLNVPGVLPDTPVSNLAVSSSNQTAPQTTNTLTATMSASPSSTASATSAATTGAPSSVSVGPLSSPTTVASGSNAAASDTAVDITHSAADSATPSTATLSGASSSVSAAPSSQGATTGATDTMSAGVTASMTSSPYGSTVLPPTSVTASSGTLGTGASITASHSSTGPADKVNPTTPAPKSKMVCNQDNCLRNMIDPRYSSSMFSFCSGYTTQASSTVALPTFLAGCAKDEKRVSSACSCLVASFTLPTLTPAITSPVMRAGTPSWRLKRSPLRWDRVRA